MWVFARAFGLPSSCVCAWEFCEYVRTDGFMRTRLGFCTCVRTDEFVRGFLVLGGSCVCVRTYGCPCVFFIVRGSWFACVRTGEYVRTCGCSYVHYPFVFGGPWVRVRTYWRVVCVGFVCAGAFRWMDSDAAARVPICAGVFGWMDFAFARAGVYLRVDFEGVGDEIRR